MKSHGYSSRSSSNGNIVQYQWKLKYWVPPFSAKPFTFSRRAEIVLQNEQKCLQFASSFPKMILMVKTRATTPSNFSVGVVKSIYGLWDNTIFQIKLKNAATIMLRTDFRPLVTTNLVVRKASTGAGGMSRKQLLGASR